MTFILFIYFFIFFFFFFFFTKVIKMKRKMQDDIHLKEMKYELIFLDIRFLCTCNKYMNTHTLSPGF